MAMAISEEGEERRKRQTEAAREALVKKRHRTSDGPVQLLQVAAGRPQQARLRGLQLTSPESQDQLVGRAASRPNGAEQLEVALGAMQKLAFLPRIRGSQHLAAIRYQKMGSCLVASCVQSLQMKCFDKFTDTFDLQGSRAIVVGLRSWP